MAYHSDYENEPIGDGNPYYRCIHCKRSDPEINGDIKKHSAECLYRRSKEAGVPYKPFSDNGDVNFELGGAETDQNS